MVAALATVPSRFWANPSTAFHKCAGLKCVYRFSMRGELHPPKAIKVRSFAPCMASLEAKVCRRSWNLKGESPAFSTALLKARLRYRPSWGNTRSGASPRCSAKRLCIEEFIGTRLRFPLLVSFTVTIPAFQSMSRHMSRRSSPWRIPVWRTARTIGRNRFRIGEKTLFLLKKHHVWQIPTCTLVLKLESEIPLCAVGGK